jgi:hypothetical protein
VTSQHFTETDDTETIVRGCYESLLLEIDETYYLEKFDPHHRPSQKGHQLLKKFNKEKKDHLSIREVKQLSEIEITVPNERSKIVGTFSSFLRKKQPSATKPQITYLDAQSAEQYRVIFSNSQMQHQPDANTEQLPQKENGVIDSLHLQGKQPHYGAYVLDNVGNMFFNEHVKGKFHHSSFTSGEKVLCSGMIKIESGKVKILNNNSGHYKPHEIHLATLIYLLKCKEVLDTPDFSSKRNWFVKGTLSLLAALHLYLPTPTVKVLYRSDTLKKVAHSLQNTSFRPLFWLGRLLDIQQFTKTYSMSDFDKKIKNYYKENTGFRKAVTLIDKTHNITEEKRNKIWGVGFFSNSSGQNPYPVGNTFETPTNIFNV